MVARALRVRVGDRDSNGESLTSVTSEQRYARPYDRRVQETVKNPGCFHGHWPGCLSDGKNRLAVLADLSERELVWGWIMS